MRSYFLFRRGYLNPLRTRCMKRRKKQEPPIGGLDELHSRKLNLRRAEPSRLLDVNGVEPNRADTGFWRTKLSRAEFSEIFNRSTMCWPMARAGFGIPHTYAASLSALSRKEKKKYCRWNRLSLRTDNPRFRATCLSTKRLLFTQHSERNTLNASRTYPCMHRTLNTSEVCLGLIHLPRLN